MKWYEAAFAQHYPVIYRHRDAAEAERCIRNLPRLAELGGGPLLDLGCGEGRHLVHLRKLVPVAVGLDLSMPLLASAQERLDATGKRDPLGTVGEVNGCAECAKSGSPLLVRGDMRWLPFPGESLTAVLSLFTAFGYFGDLEAHTGLVAEIAGVLTPGGHWFLDYLNCDHLVNELKEDTNNMRESERGPFLIREERILAGDGRRPSSAISTRDPGPTDTFTRPDQVRKRVTLKPRPGCEEEAAALGVTSAGLTYEEQVALFSLEEMDALAERHGLARVTSAGDYDAGPLTADSPRWLLVYRRRGA
jgi:SAM-dependent methyltransferase